MQTHRSGITPISHNSFTDKCFPLKKACHIEVWSCDGNKCPGPDGFNLRFIKEFWDTLKEDFVGFFDEFFVNGKLVKGVNNSFITLIPKNDNPQGLGDYRPISLIGSVYKVLTKVLANRMSRVMPTIISGSQSAFVKGRQILDGVLIANEVVEEARRLRRALVCFKVDFEKAYDSVNWEYLWDVMGKMGFGPTWVSWMRECVCLTKSSVLINGSPTEEFNVGRGLRQGDPLSPFLFLIAAEGLNQMVQLAVSLDLWKSFIVGKDKIQISHLQFADDTLLLTQGDWRSLETIKAILQNFELVSGLKVNFSKSNLIGMNMPDQWLEQGANLLNCRRGAFPFKYLGLPVGDHPARGAMWQVIVEVVQRRLALWENKYISLAGRVILLKSVLSALPTYFLSFYKAPTGKWKWRMLTEPNSQWVRVLNSKYAKEDGSWVVEGRTCSKWWVDMQSVVDAVHGCSGWWNQHVRHVLGNGKQTRFWHDRWIGETRFWDEFSRLYEISLNKNDSVEGMYEGGSKWRWSWRRPLFAWEEEKLVELANRLASVVLTEAHPDEWRWLAERSGKYSVASAYKILAKSNHVQVDTFYDTIWAKGIPPKVQVLVWQLEADRLPTRDNLLLRGVNLEGQNGCVFCEEGSESSKHLFLLCPKAYAVWVRLYAWWGVSGVLINELRSFCHQYMGLVSGSKGIKRVWSFVWFAGIWQLWKARNENIFKDKLFKVEEIVFMAQLRSWEWCTAARMVSSSFPEWLMNPLSCASVP
ncbi:uncharacterized protein LOC109803368 [Cajanus cajan]|uniref:uncharacterized protein LOC109803368 n=1 Tax=Cajanus cajan TaxID=3821 RepID=UPI00098D823F|nr:uncharacterized protein LOC109803368 [Cajanus cajan]